MLELLPPSGWNFVYRSSITATAQLCWACHISSEASHKQPPLLTALFEKYCFNLLIWIVASNLKTCGHSDLLLLSLLLWINIIIIIHWTLQIPGFCEGGAGSSIPGVKGHVNCDVLVGYKAVYRICFGMAMFFLLFSLLMIKVKSSRDPRAALHNG